ncbi:permease-like cell division protein FtsX [Clostridium sp. D33t1_170424_F3]|uniref:permease-like cell division protein FtsX n=1 Tax=Clostridium sp. D33t1_170424_F3 TaxID=2787099 RepID=UPI0018AB9413|nr:permease-like cell division protein FtsX [Clostridium sp. D33t1_170424_F3]
MRNKSIKKEAGSPARTSGGRGKASGSRVASLQYLLKEGVRNIWSNRTMSFASIGVLVSCLVLTGAAILFSMNVDVAMKSLEGNNSTTVYLQEGLPTLTSLQVGQEIKKLDNIEDCEFVSKEDAVQNMLDMLGDDGTVLSGLLGDENFLPDAFRISVKDLALYDETAAEIKAINGVDEIIDYSDIAEKLMSMDNLVTTAGFWVILMLSLVSLFIISNTIRVTMFSRRLEISIMKSVGATNWFVRVPFIVEGVIIGLFSGGVASLLLNLVYSKLIESLTSIPVFSPVDIGPISWEITLAFVLTGTLFGAIGGLISLGKYLKKEGGDVVGF